MHACVTYSHVGDWYYMADSQPSTGERLLFLFWQAHLQAFFMGILFFVAGVFAAGSLERRGRAGFLRERARRLGLPTLFYMLAIHPFILLVLNPWGTRFPPAGAFYRHYLISGRFLGSSGPMWFAFALLIFCCVLASTGPFGSAEPKTSEPLPAPSAGRLWFFAAALGVASFLIRTRQPLGSSVMNFQLCYFAQYVAAFGAGLAAARGGWLGALASSRRAANAGWSAILGGPILLLALVSALRWNPAAGELYRGGWNVPAFELAMWEQLTGLGLGLGILALFSRFAGAGPGWLRWAGDRSFGVYLLHPPVLVALAMAFRSLPQEPVLLAALLTVAGLTGSFILADLARRIPGLRSIV